MPLADAFLPEFDREMEGLRRMLERVPAERLDWRPHPDARTLGELADHLARIPGWVSGMLVDDGYDLAKNEHRGSATPPVSSKDELLARFETNRARAREAIATRSDEELGEPWSLERQGQVLRTLPRSRVLRTFLLDHVIHHRGQLSVYLRLLDVPAPDLYGAGAGESS